MQKVRGSPFGQRCPEKSHHIRNIIFGENKLLKGCIPNILHSVFLSSSVLIWTYMLKDKNAKWNELNKSLPFLYANSSCSHNLIDFISTFNLFEFKSAASIHLCPFDVLHCAVAVSIPPHTWPSGGCMIRSCRWASPGYTCSTLVHFSL